MINKGLLKHILSNLLPWPLPNQLEQLTPARFTVPSGNAHAIDYSRHPPVLAVKLQELFGMQQPPSVSYGTALQVHLSATGRKPITNKKKRKESHIKRSLDA